MKKLLRISATIILLSITKNNCAMAVNAATRSYTRLEYERELLRPDAPRNFLREIPSDITEQIFRFVDQEWKGEYTEKMLDYMVDEAIETQNFTIPHNTEQYLMKLAQDARDNPYFHNEIQKLITENPLDLTNALEYSLTVGNQHLTHTLLQARANPNCNLPNFTNSMFCGMTPLGFAIIKRNHVAAELLLAHGANPNQITYSAEEPSSEFEELLSPKLIGIRPRCPLEIAQEQKDDRIIQLLQKHGAQPKKHIPRKIQVSLIVSGAVLVNLALWSAMGYLFYHGITTKQPEP